MKFQAEINYFLKLMESFRIPVKILIYGVEHPRPLDNGIRMLLNPQTDYKQITDEIILNIDEKVIYKVTDDFNLSYMFMRLPDGVDDKVLSIGPYSSVEITRSLIIRKSKNQAISPDFLSTLEKYFSTVAYIPDDHTLMVSLYTLGEILWESEQLRVENLQNTVLQFEEGIFGITGSNSYNTAYDIQVIEKRYLSENKLMEAVRYGRTHEAERLLRGFSQAAVEQRASEPTRNARNYLIILNTLMRKSVEQGNVHPFHIDKLSSKFARKIENIGSWSDVGPLCREMAKKYCALVNEQSLQSYSPIVKQVITKVDYDLTADLSLRAIAEDVGANASYLSSVFKKETGRTLTDFVNSRRVEKAVFLLQATNMPVATIGQHCGITDSNYFTKIFKKHTGKTPKEYRSPI